MKERHDGILVNPTGTSKRTITNVSRVSATAALAVLLSVTLAACSSSSHSGGSASAANGSTTANPTGTLPIQVPAGVKIVIADNADMVKTLMRLSGQQSQLAEKVSYVNFTSGPLRLQALQAGAVTAAAVGDVPAVLAQFSHDNVLNFIATSQPNSTNVTTAPGSGIKTWKDLIGKKIGVNQGTGQQAITLRDLKANGISPSQVKWVNLGLAEFDDGLRGHQIDAAPLDEPDQARFVAQSPPNSVTVLPNAPSASQTLQYFYASASALKNPTTAAALRDFAIHYYRALAWRNTHPKQWETGYLIDDQQLSASSAQAVISTEGTTTVPGFTAAVIATQQNTIDLLQQSGAFGGPKLNAAAEFDMRFANLNANSPTTK